MNLDKKQLKIVNSKSDYTLVVAGHGAGKTLIASQKAIIEAKRINNENGSIVNRKPPILILSHTTNARDKINKQIQAIDKIDSIRAMIEVKTFHSFALKSLHENNFVRFTINQNYAQFIVDKIYSGSFMGNDLSSKEKDEILFICEYYIERGKDLETIVKQKPQNFKNRKKVLKAIIKADKLLRKSGAIPIQQLPNIFCEVVKKQGMKQVIKFPPKIIIIDEFQDIIDSQWEMIKSFENTKTKLFAIGDPDQAIFPWAGASTKRFEQFQKRYNSCAKYILKINYRSSKQIVKFCDAIRKNAKKDKGLVSKAKFSAKKPKIICSKAYWKLISSLIKHLKRLKSGGVSLNEVAILYRFHSNRRMLISSLESSGIPYQIYEKTQRKMRPIIRIIFAYERIIRNINDKEPDSDIWESWNTILLLVDGVGVKRVKEIIEWLQARKPGSTSYPRYTQFSSQLRSLIKFIERKSVSFKTEPPEVYLKGIVDQVMKFRKHNRSNNDKELSSLFYLASKTGTLREALDRYNDPSFPTCYPAGKNYPPFPDEYLTLSTVHKIKGSEFKNVIYLGTDDTLFERHQCFNGSNKLHEELLMNVACSRARKNLLMLFPVSREDWESKRKAANPWTIIRAIPSKLYLIRHI